ncbi:MAG TPA: hypothetical protein DEP72_02905 [Clostridiales bacterium]|nr:hypothetical protein [Clostridiales bacterium]
MDIYTKGFESLMSTVDELKQKKDIKVIVFGCTQFNSADVTLLLLCEGSKCKESGLKYYLF